jgi:CubicO group peptidase (beta-lactamase class C family)
MAEKEIQMKTSLSRTMLSGFLACLLLSLALAFTVQPVGATPQAGAPDIASIDAYISAQMQADHIPGVALGLVHNDQVMHLRGFGEADQSGRAVTPKTPFVLASVSKSFTSLAVMQLVEAGKIELDAPVQRYLPWFRVADPVASARITVRHLLYQTSGIPGSGYACATEQATMSLEQYVRSLATLPLDRPVGSRHEYCSTNYDILGLIVQTVSGEPYATYTEQHIFAPLQMHDSFATEPEARRDGLAQGYRWIYGVPAPFDYYNTAGVPAGYLISSAGDLAHYLIAQMNGGRFGSATLLSSAGIATMHAPAVPREGGRGYYGMGWVNGPFAGVPAIWHDGEDVNFHALLLIEPQTHWGVILLVNADTLLPVDGAANTALTSLDAGVTRLMAGQTPQASPSLTTVYLITDGVLAVLLAIFPLLRLQWWSNRFRQRRHRLVHLGLRLTWDVALPVALLVGVSLFARVLGATSWYWILLGWPDLGSWILAISALLLLTGVLRAVLAFRVLLRIAEETSPVKLSPSCRATYLTTDVGAVERSSGAKPR